MRRKRRLSDFMVLFFYELEGVGDDVAVGVGGGEFEGGGSGEGEGGDGLEGGVLGVGFLLVDGFGDDVVLGFDCQGGVGGAVRVGDIGEGELIGGGVEFGGPAGEFI